MKKAIQYAIACDYLKPGDVEGLEKVFKAAMLDAFKAGMTEAATKARSIAAIHSNPSIESACMSCARVIEQARDLKTSV